MTPLAISTLRAGDEVAGIFACTRKDRLVSRSGAPYLAVELRDRTGALPARVFRDADLHAGRFDRGDLVLDTLDLHDWYLSEQLAQGILGACLKHFQ